MKRKAQDLQGAGVYLLHFSEPYHHAAHYLGYADNVELRIAEHEAGRGARLTQVVTAAGIDLWTARVWIGQGRAFERCLKNRHDLGAFCPFCCGAKAYKTRIPPMSPNYIGFATLENFLAAADPTQPVNGLPITERQPADAFGLATHKHIIILSQGREPRELLYCRILTIRYQTLGGEPLGPLAEVAPAATESAWEIVQAEVAAAGFLLRPATAAMPEGYKLLDGTADCLSWSPDRMRFERRPRQSDRVTIEEGSAAA